MKLFGIHQGLLLGGTKAKSDGADQRNLALRSSELHIDETMPRKHDEEDGETPRKLDPIKSYLQIASSDSRCTFQSHQLENYGSAYQVGSLIIQKSTSYKIECCNEHFKGFQGVFLKCKSSKSQQFELYESAVAPLVGEFVHKQRNVCLLLHGAVGSGRTSTLFGIGANIDGSRVSSHVESPGISNQDDGNDHAREYNDDDLSSLGSDGVSELQGIQKCGNKGTTPKVSAIPQEVSFGTQSIKHHALDNGHHRQMRGEEEGIVPRLITGICEALHEQFPEFSYSISQHRRLNKKDVPQLIPKELSTMYCRHQLQNEMVDDDSSSHIDWGGDNVSFSENPKTHARRTSSFTIDTNLAHLGSSRRDPNSQSLKKNCRVFIALRVSCFEVVDDLASGDSMVYDLLSDFQDDYDDEKEDTVIGFGERVAQSSALISPDNIRHDRATGIVYAEESVEMRCQSRAAVMECLLKAERSRQGRQRGREIRGFQDKLFHTAYFVSVEHNDPSLSREVIISRQVGIFRIDESMSNSASLALHSSCSALHAVISELSSLSISPPIRQNPMTKLLQEFIGGECCTVAIGTVSSKDEDIALPTLRFGEAVSWVYNFSNNAVDVASAKVEIPSEETEEHGLGESNNALLPIRQNSIESFDNKQYARHFQVLNTSINEHEIQMFRESDNALMLSMRQNSSDSEGNRRVDIREKKRFMESDNSLCLPTIQQVGSTASYDDFDSNSFTPVVDGAADTGKLINAMYTDTAIITEKLNADKSSLAHRSDLTHSNPASVLTYDAVKDAKAFLAELDLEQDILGETKIAKPDIDDDENNDDDNNRTSWQDTANVIKRDIEQAREKILTAMSEEFKTTPLEIPPASPEAFSNGGYPPEFVNAEMSNIIVEDTAMLLFKMQQSHDLELSKMQRTIEALRKEIDELKQEKEYDSKALEQAHEDIHFLVQKEEDVLAEKGV